MKSRVLSTGPPSLMLALAYVIASLNPFAGAAGNNQVGRVSTFSAMRADFGLAMMLIVMVLMALVLILTG